MKSSTIQGRLAARHLEDLRESGLSDETIAVSGIWSASAADVKEILGFAAGAGMAIPYPGTDPLLTRIKPDKPFKDKDDKIAKYLSPLKKMYAAGNRLFIPANLHTLILTDAGVDLIITEGEKKALKAVQEGFSTVALSGVTCWKTRVPDGTSKPIQDLDRIVWRARRVYVAFDSDVTTKAAVRHELHKLTHELGRRGASVFVLTFADVSNQEDAA